MIILVVKNGEIRDLIRYLLENYYIGIEWFYVVRLIEIYENEI